LPKEFWLILPLVLIQVSLMVMALVDLLGRRPKNVLLWGVLIVLLSIVGPVLYFALGRKEKGDESGHPDG